MFETSWRRNDGASLLRPFEMSLWRSNKTSWRRTTETSWRRYNETSLGVSFETCLRRCGDVIMGCRCYVLLRGRYDVPIRRGRDARLRRLGDVPSKRRWVFHLRRTCNVTGTYRETSLWRRHDVLMPGGIAWFQLKNVCVQVTMFVNPLNLPNSINRQNLIWNWNWNKDLCNNHHGAEISVICLHERSAIKLLILIRY